MLGRWPSHLERWIDREFERATDGLVGGDFCKNPVTGSWFILGVDPISVQKEQALQAHLARLLFQLTKPADFPQLPVDSRDWATIEYESPAD